VAREARFDYRQWEQALDRFAALMSAVIAFDCRVMEIKAVASHDIYFGIVEAIHQGDPERRWSITTAPTSRSDLSFASMQAVVPAPRIGGNCATK
jgi:flavin reductase (DIM6/NTAB) family NADH-FMN oxidoreductase RutF